MREVSNSKVVLDAIHQRLKDLVGERRVAVRVEQQEALKELARGQLALSGPLDQHLADLVQACAAWVDRETAIYQVTSDLGAGSSRTPRTALAWIISEAFHQIAPHHFERSPLPGVSFTLLAEEFADVPAPAEQEDERREA